MFLTHVSLKTMFSLPLQYSVAANGQQLRPSCHPEMGTSLVCVCNCKAIGWRMAEGLERVLEMGFAGQRPV